MAVPAISQDYVGWLAVKFAPGDSKFSWIPLLAGSDASIPNATVPVFAAAASSYEPITRAVPLSIPTITVRTHAHTCWFTKANVRKMLGAATGGTISTYAANRPGGQIVPCASIQLFDGVTKYEWSNFVLSTLQLVSYGSGPLDVSMVLAPFGSFTYNETPFAGLTDVTSPAPDPLDAIPFQAQGCALASYDGVTQLAFSFSNTLEPVIAHNAVASAVNGPILPQAYKVGWVNHSLVMDQMDSATVKPDIAFGSTASVQVAFNDPALDSGAKVTLSTTYFEPARTKRFSLASGLSVTRWALANGSDGVIPSLEVS